MPIVIMPNGEMVDSTTGNPVNTPTPMPENMGQFIANRPDQMGRGETMSVMEKMKLLMDMGLTEGEAIDAIAMEESAGEIDPKAFAGMDRGDALKGAATATMGMGALGGVPMGGQSVMDRPGGMMGGQPRRTPMPTPMPNDMGADRTMNPMDRITSRNAPST